MHKKLMTNISITLALLLLLTVMYDMISWIRIASAVENFNEAKAVYLNRFPAFLQRAGVIVILLIEILLLLLSAWLFHRASADVRLLRWLKVLSLVLAGFLIFSLM